MATALSDAALDQLFRTARSRNAWSDQPLDPAMIERIFDVMKWGPTSANGWPARFIWVQSDEAKQRLASCASGTNAPKILAAPVTVIIGRDASFHEKLPTLFPHSPQMHEIMRQPAVAHPTAQRNATLQGAYLMIAARALGLDCGPMSGFDAKKVDAEFWTGTDISTDFLCSLGYGSDRDLFERLPRPDFADVNSVV